MRVYGKGRRNAFIAGLVVVVVCIGFWGGYSSRGSSLPAMVQPTTPENVAELLHQSIAIDDYSSFQGLWLPAMKDKGTKELFNELHAHMNMDNAEFVTQEVIRDKDGHELVVDLSSLDPKGQLLISNIQINK